MADLKISALPAASVALAGTEVLPIVQSSATKQVTVANLTAGRSVSVADLAVSTGNIVQGTAAKGVNFTANTPAAGMTSQLLNWYEEGTWTPVIRGTTSPGVGTYTEQVGKYTRIGKRVFFTCNLDWTAHTGTGAMRLGGLPFNVENTGGTSTIFTCIAYGVALTAGNVLTGGYLFPNEDQGYLLQTPSGGGVWATVPMDTVGTILASGNYSV